MSGETLDPRQLAGIAIEFFLMHRDEQGLTENEARLRAVDDIAETVRRVQVSETLVEPEAENKPASCRGTATGGGRRCSYSRR
jgi:hypothetical protein